jgi:hypothetical protein
MAEQAIRAWANSAAVGLTGEGHPVSGGFYLRQQRSPAAGQYGVLARSSIARPGPVAEDDGFFDQARISALFYGGTEETAEAAATAYASAVERLSGRPVPAGDSGLTILASDNLSGPQYVPMPAEGGELFAFEVAADFLLAAQ